jgi:nucleoside-diphosphate-sugar epimerase
MIFGEEELMDKAIIFGIYDFVSFHACKELLNKGLEVIGIHIDDPSKYQFLEEKRLEVGRNANFREIPLLEWEHSREEDDTKTIFIFSIYDLYMLDKEGILQEEEVIKGIRKLMEGDKNNNDVVVILPIQLLIDSKEKIIPDFLERAKEWGHQLQLFYLPTIYGPWQPTSFVFQQALLAKQVNKDKITKNDREWTKDALFVNDAIEAILQGIEGRNVEKTVGNIIESGQTNYWNQCAEYLQIEIDREFGIVKQDEPLSIDKQIVKISVKKVTPLAESLTKQLEQVQRLYPN